jgi:uncharacterized membrane protein YhaH (DUF805 family)
MNPDYTALYSYITAHRQNGATDAAIHQSLVASGWPDAVIQQALNATPHPFNPVTPQLAGQPYQPLDTTPAPEVGFFKGRIGRLGYLMASVYLLAYFIFAVLLGLLTGHGSRTSNILVILLGMAGVLVAIPLGISLHIRRWHDLGQSGWLTLLNLVPGVGIITAIILTFIPGTSGPNTYGTTHPKSLSPKVVFGLSK